MKLYLDESVSVALATMLAQHGIDCLTVRDAGHLGQSDEFQLRVATETELSGPCSPMTHATSSLWRIDGTPQAVITVVSSSVTSCPFAN